MTSDTVSNGVPFARSPGMASPLIRDDQPTVARTIWRHLAAAKRHDLVAA